MQFNEDVLQKFRTGRVFKPSEGNDSARINSIAFHRTHDVLVTASDDDAIRVYDTCRGVEQRVLFSKKYGVANICFSHDPNSVLYSSTKGNNMWRYHDLYANKYLRYFEGHAGRVTSLCLSPKTDQVLSAAEDKQVRLWDLRSSHCVALLQAPGIPTASWDEQGLVFCVGSESGTVKLFDARKWTLGPFTTFTVANEQNSNAVFASIKFSLDGKYLLAVVEGRIYVLDAFSGKTLRQISTGLPDGTTALEACMTADGRFVLSGCGDKKIRAWDISTGSVMAEWSAHPDIPACLKFSPRKMLAASACQSLLLWIPDL